MNIAFIRKYFSFGWPIILSQFIVIFANNISVALMGNLSEFAISGYTLANESFSFFSMIALGIAGGFHIYISQYYGAKDLKKCNQLLRYGNKVCLMISIICSLCFFIFADEFIGIFAKDKEIVLNGVTYLRIFAWTFIPYIMNLLWSSTYSFIGMPQVTMIGGVLDSIITVLSCYLFLNYFNMGIKGAALSILTGRIVESLFLLYKLNSPDSVFDLKGKFPSLLRKEKEGVLFTSGPLIINESLFSLAFILIMKNYSFISETSVGCITVVNYLQQLFFICNKAAEPVIGIMVGGELGKGNFKKAKLNAKRTFLLASLCGIIGAFLMISISDILPSLFSYTGSLKILCKKMIIAKAIISIFGGNTLVFYNILRTGGNTKEVFKFDGIFTLVGPLFCSYLFSRIFKVSFFMLYVIVESMNILKTILGIYLYKKEKWVRNLHYVQK